MQNQDRPIAFFDSGLGGISVLRETRAAAAAGKLSVLRRLAPRALWRAAGGGDPRAAGAAAEQLVQAGAKALVVACNTATSAAIVQLREAYPDIPVIGTEPALKPAVEKYPGGRILVMATPMTIRQEKFQALKAQYDDQAEIIGLACGGLMEFVERGELRGEALDAYLFDKLGPYLKVPVDAIVLGCTHYPFLTGAIRRIVGRGRRSWTAATASPCSWGAGCRRGHAPHAGRGRDRGVPELAGRAGDPCAQPRAAAISGRLKSAALPGGTFFGKIKKGLHFFCRVCYTVLVRSFVYPGKKEEAYVFSWRIYYLRRGRRVRGRGSRKAESCRSR
ncbi:MAG: aspartate/glutamate racemase family protein [Oscillospiraceae bacterium]